MFLIADCAVCAANSTDYGWFILAGTVLTGALAVAGIFAYLDGRGRPVLPTQIED